jgi:hypothetical protein
MVGRAWLRRAVLVMADRKQRGADWRPGITFKGTPLVTQLFQLGSTSQGFHNLLKYYHQLMGKH